jgi:hypothetical protein
MNDESHLPVSEQSLVYRLRKRAEIRRNIADRKSVQENKPDRIADLLEEAANEIDRLKEFESMCEKEYKRMENEKLRDGRDMNYGGGHWGRR